jgi:hypothetical protein
VGLSRQRVAFLCRSDIPGTPGQIDGQGETTLL